ncbi:MAG: TetR/AcrR family transcriptional regulator [Actinobacteria bacterium]|nr:TetR/AcrR family transcriptional regulator [Actinomycetota bacterium]
MNVAPGTTPDDVARPSAADPRRRVLDAALACIARRGITKTTLEDIAREAGCSRATIYRMFPGGKETLVGALTVEEALRFMEGLGAHLDQADDLVSMLEGAVLYASRIVAGHQALQFLFAHEPEQIIPTALGRGRESLSAISAFLAPYMAKHVGDLRAGADAEWVVRLVFSYNLAPSRHFDLTSVDDVRRFVGDYVLPCVHPRTTTPRTSSP